MTSMINRLALLTVIAMVVWLGAANSASASQETYSIPTSGGDCYQIGEWDDVTRTCTLNRDVNGEIHVAGIYQGGVTIDGNGHTVSGDGGGVGVMLPRESHHNVIKNLTITGFSYGIYLYQASDNVIAGNTITDNWVGVYLLSQGCLSTLCGDSIDNDIYNNNFLSNKSQLLDEYFDHYPYPHDSTVPIYLVQNRFNLDLPAGGNFWEGWTGPDDNNDGIVDAPYIIAGAQTDTYPWTEPNGWLCERPELSIAVTGIYWANYTDYTQRSLSIDFVIANEGTQNAGQLSITGSAISSGVLNDSDYPSLLGSVEAGASTKMTLKYRVPAGIDRFHVIIQATALDSCGNTRPLNMS